MSENLVVRNESEERMKKFSFIYLMVFCVSAFIDAVEVMVPYVIAFYGVLSVASIVYIVLYFKKVGLKNKWSFPVICFTVFSLFTIISMIVNKGSMDRNAVAIFNLLEILSVFAAVYELYDRIDEIIRIISSLVACFSTLVLLLSLDIFNTVMGAGITPNPNTLAILLVSGIMSAIYLLIFNRNIVIKIAMGFCAVFLGAGLFKTESRTSYMSILIGLVLFSFLLILKFSRPERRKIYILSAVLCVVLISMVIVPRIFVSKYGSSSIFSGREAIWQDSIKAVKGRSFLGFGGNTALIGESFSQFNNESTLYFAKAHLLHNIYIQILVEYGFVALVSFLAAVLFILLKIFVEYIRKEHIQKAIAFAFSMVALFLVHGCAESSILYIGGQEQFCFTFFLAVLYAELYARKGRNV